MTAVRFFSNGPRRRVRAKWCPRFVVRSEVRWKWRSSVDESVGLLMDLVAVLATHVAVVEIKESVAVCVWS